MAEQLETFHFGRSRREYPWDEWETGIWKVTRGVDFKCRPESFISLLHQRARRVSQGVLTHRLPDAVVFQFYDREET